MQKDNRKKQKNSKENVIETKFLKKAIEIYKLQTDYEGKEMQKSEMFIMIELESHITDIKEIIGDIMGNFMPINLITSMKWMIYTNTINSRKKTKQIT